MACARILDAAADGGANSQRPGRRHSARLPHGCRGQARPPVEQPTGQPDQRADQEQLRLRWRPQRRRLALHDGGPAGAALRTQQGLEPDHAHADAYARVANVFLDTESGLGDIVTSLWFSPARPTAGGWILGLGPAVLFPPPATIGSAPTSGAAGPRPWRCVWSAPGPACSLPTSSGA